MKQIWMVGILILAYLLMVGCRTESDRLADMAERTVEMQSTQNRTVAETNDELTKLNRDIQTERSALSQGFKDLEQDRQHLHQQRRSELAWAESFRFLAIVIAAIMPLLLSAFLIWAATRNTADSDLVNEVLIQELVSKRPRLIAGPNRSLMDNKTQNIISENNSANQLNNGGDKNDVTHCSD